MTLNEAMEIDRVIEVRPDGTVTAGPAGIDSPTVSVSVDTDGQVINRDATGIEIAAPWLVINGYSNQFGYRGPIMHPSEFIGGALECDILARPGLYAAVAVNAISPNGFYDDFTGWAVVFREK